MEFGSLINELESNKIDIIATGMFIKERSRRITFFGTKHLCETRPIVAQGNPETFLIERRTKNAKDTDNFLVGRRMLNHKHQN
jgi:ABC-type amino acid transport substrate-binding protein